MKNTRAAGRATRTAIKKLEGGVGGPTGPSTVFVSAGFPGGAGLRFCLQNRFLTAFRDRERSDQRKAAKLKKVAAATFLTR